VVGFADRECGERMFVVLREGGGEPCSRFEFVCQVC
jgi:hypothetical protein